MGRIRIVLLSVLFISACALKNRHSDITQPIPPSPEIRIENLNLRAARASMKVRNKVIGLINFAQNDSNIKVEVQIEGLKSGPYELHLATKENCKNPSLKHHAYKDLGEVIADKNGVVKANVEFTNMSTNDLVNKTIILHSKNKRFPKATACGQIEKI